MIPSPLQLEVGNCERVRGGGTSYVKAEIDRKGYSAIVNDVGVLGKLLIKADMCHQELTRDGVKSLRELVEASGILAYLVPGRLVERTFVYQQNLSSNLFFILESLPPYHFTIRRY